MTKKNGIKLNFAYYIERGFGDLKSVYNENNIDENRIILFHQILFISFPGKGTL